MTARHSAPLENASGGSAAGHRGPPAPGGGRGATRVGPRRDRLRRASGVLHRALEARLEGAGSFDSLDGYARYLGAVAPLYAALEGTLDAAGAGRLLPDWPRRRKAGLIRADLRELGAAGTAVSFPCPGLQADLPPPWHAGAVLAALYVLEGATLGGAVLARRVLRLGVTRERGAASLDPYGPDRGAMWRGFLDALEGAALTPEEEADLGPRAAAVFALFAARFPAPAPAAPLRSSPVPA